MLGMNKYFRVQNFCENIKTSMTIFNLKRKADIWWEELRNVKDIREKEMYWERFKRYSKKKYLSEEYYDKNAK